MTETLEQEERTEQDDKPRFSLVHDDEERVFLGIFTGDTHYLVELEQHDIARLQKKLREPSIPMKA